jgi:hypothetical protein
MGVGEGAGAKGVKARCGVSAGPDDGDEAAVRYGACRTRARVCEAETENEHLNAGRRNTALRHRSCALTPATGVMIPPRVLGFVHDRRIRRALA